MLWLLYHHEKEGKKKEKSRTHTSYVSLRFHELVEVWLDESEPLFDTAFHVATTFSDVSNDSSRKTEVSICLTEDSQIEKIKHALIMKSKDAF